MHDQGSHDQGSNFADQAIEEIKRSVDEAIIRTEDAIDKVMDVAAVAEASEDYRTKMFDFMRNNINAAFGYAHSLGTVKSPADLVGSLSEQAKSAGAPLPTPDLSAAAGAAEEYRAQMLRFMQNNLNAALDYAEELAGVRSPSEFIELSTSHARKQFEAISAQTTELTALAQKLAASPGDALGLSKLFNNGSKG